MSYNADNEGVKLASDRLQTWKFNYNLIHIGDMHMYNCTYRSIVYVGQAISIIIVICDNR